jgi:hypothetical protein
MPTNAMGFGRVHFSGVKFGRVSLWSPPGMGEIAKSVQETEKI